MDKAKRFFNLVRNGTTADLDIYGDIVSEGWSWEESDMNVFRLSRLLEELQGVTQINVNINSYGGEVAEGIAIYNALVRHEAKIVTRCDGMACSIASVIFMAGEERIMYEPSMLMIHNASSFAWGTAAELRKAAEDNEKITSMSKAAYMQCVSITEEELTALMDAETWITPAEALNMGFATAVESRENPDTPSQSARAAAFDLMAASLGRLVPATLEAFDDDDDEEGEPDDDGIEVDADDDGDDEGEGQEDPDDGGDADDGQDPDDEDEDEGEGQEDPDDEDDDGEKKDEQRLRSFVMSAYK